MVAKQARKGFWVCRPFLGGLKNAVFLGPGTKISHALIFNRYYNQYGFMTHHWKACAPNKLKMPACKLYLV